MILLRTNASEQLLMTLTEKREATPEEFYGTGAMIERQWTKKNCELRHVMQDWQSTGSTTVSARPQRTMSQMICASVHCVETNVNATI